MNHRDALCHAIRQGQGTNALMYLGMYEKQRDQEQVTIMVLSGFLGFCLGALLVWTC